MKRIQSQPLRLAVSQLFFILMLSLPLLTFPADSVFPRFLPDMLAFTCLGLWGLFTVAQKETRAQSLELNSLSMLALVWAALVLAQHATGLIQTYWSFTFISLGYFLAMVLIGGLVKLWINAGYKKELFQSFLTAILLVSVINALVVLIQSSPYIELFSPVIEKGNATRPGGFISQTNIAGSWFVCGLIALVFINSSSDRKTSQPTFVNVTLLVILLWVINITASRVALLELYAITLVLFVMRKKFSISKIWVLMPVWQFAVYLLWEMAIQFWELKSSPGLFARLLDSQQNRYEIYQGAINIIQDHPWLGIGWRQLQLEQISRPELSGVVDHAHNLLLHIQLELGIVGSIALVIFLLYWLYQKHMWTSSDPVITVGLLISMVFGIHSMTEFPLWYAPSLFAFSVAIALVDKPSSLHIKVKPNLMILLFTLQLTVLAWVYVDHSIAYGKIEKYVRDEPFIESAETYHSWWFKTYDDYRVLQANQITPENQSEYKEQTIQLANFFTPAIPYLHLLKIYIFSKNEEKALGMARKFCKVDPAYWQKIVAYHLINGPKEMQDWILALPTELKQCASSESHP